MKATQFLAAACIAFTLTGCKLAIMVPPGGMVESSSGTRNCDGGTDGQFCTFDLTAVKLPYSETFTATAKPGYRFVKWQKADDFKCGDSTESTCAITASDNALGKVIMSSFWTGYLMPVFEYLGIDTDGDGVVDPHDNDDDNDGLDDSVDNCPLTWPNDDGLGCPDPLPDSIMANGKEWAQPLTFINLSWEQIDEVCPPVHGLSLCKGQLNGVDLRGWRWATSAEVKSHMQSYAGSGGGCEKITHDFKFVKDPIYDRGQMLLGWVSDSSAHQYLVTDSSSMLPCFHELVRSGLHTAGTGSWFYRVRE